ncbi:MAG: hypothetical protein ACOYOL_10025 [Chthoniobacterales bacterium]
MFSQLHFSEWSTVGAIVALLVTFSGFVAIVIATLRYPKRKIEELENLPWKGDKNS